MGEQGQVTEPDLSHITPDLRSLAVPIKSVVKDPDNLRLHGKTSIEGIRGSLAKFTQRKPIVVNRTTGVIEAGNGTVDALIANSKTHVAAVFVEDDPLTATAYAIADNRTAELSTWDTEALAKTIDALGDFDVPGVDTAWLDTLAPLAPPPPEDQADVEPDALPDEPTSKPFELYLLGPHRLRCGSSTEAAGVALLMNGERARMVATDPPYGTGLVVPSLKNRPMGIQIKNDQLTAEGTEALWRESLTLACKHTVEGGGIYACGPIRGPTLTACLNGYNASGFLLTHMLIWNKNRFVLGMSDYHPKHETIFYGWKPGAAHLYTGDRKQTTVWDVDRPSSSPDHPTTKPVELIERMVRHTSRKGDVVYDPFLGSGTTLIAAARLGRRCFGNELDPRYCDVIRKRWGEWARQAGVDPGTGAL